MQALAQTTFFTESYDLSVVSRLDWDWGASGPLRTLYLDSTATSATTLAADCESLMPAFRQIDSSGRLQNCANTRIARMSSTSEIDDALFCTHYENTVCSRTHLCVLRRMLYTCEIRVLPQWGWIYASHLSSARG